MARWLLRRGIIPCCQQFRKTVAKGVRPFLELHSFLVGLQQQQSISFTAVNIFLSITAFLGNSLILVALNKETFLSSSV